MLPTQFLPEYYRDAKDRRWADWLEPDVPLAKRQPRLRFTRLRSLLHRPRRVTPEEQPPCDVVPAR